MKKLLYGIIIFTFCVINIHAQHSTIDSAYVVNGFSSFYLHHNYTTPVPTGPDYGCMLVTEKARWMKLFACSQSTATAKISIDVHYSSAGNGDTISFIVWGPFYDTTNMVTQLTASNIFYCNNFINSFFGDYDIELNNVQVPAMYVLMVAATPNVYQQNLKFDYNMGPNTNIYYDKRCGYCPATGVVNYQQPPCMITYDTATSCNVLYWDKNQNFGIDYFKIMSDTASGFLLYDSIGSVPVSAAGSFTDIGNSCLTSSFRYRIDAIDSCGNKAAGFDNKPITSWDIYNISSDYINATCYYSLNYQNSNNYWYYILRGSSQSQLNIIDSVFTNVNLNFWDNPGAPQGLNCYNLLTYDTVGCQPDSTTLVSEIRSGIAYSMNICIVAYDSVSQKNAIIWDKQDNRDVTSFNIYREGSVTGVFDSIGNIPESAPTFFIDNGVNPNTKSYRYQVKPCNASGVITNVPVYISTHATMHMQASAGLFGEVNLNWNPYEGFDYQTFYIYRGTSLNAMAVIDSIAANTNTYTDYTAPPGLNFYRVTVKNLFGCHPDSNQLIIESKSNNSYAVVTGISNPEVNNLAVYPNPADEYLTIDYGKLKRVNSLEILNSNAQLVRYYDASLAKQLYLPVHDLTPGVYYIKAVTDDSVIRKKFVIN